MIRLRSRRWRHEHRRALRALAVAGTGTILAGSLATAAAAAGGAFTDPFGSSQVGSTSSSGAILLATQQWIKPAGTRLLDNQGRILASAVSPDGTYLAGLTWNDFTGYLTIYNLKTQTIVARLGTGTKTDPSIGDGSVAADGPLWAPDGKTLYLPQTSDILKVAVASDGTPTLAGAIPTVNVVVNLNSGTTTTPDLPSGMELSADGSKLYVALNGANELAVISTATDKIEQLIPVGNAPRQVVLAGGYAYVSNEGGRPAKPGDFTNESDGTAIVSSKVTGAATTGTVSVVSLKAGKEVREIPVGLEPTAEYLAPGGTLVVANSNNDSVSLIKTSAWKVTQTVNTNPLATAGTTVGSYPNAITLVGHTLLVSIGRDNAVAVFNYSAGQPLTYQGLIPTDFYPVNVAFDKALGAHGEVVVTNDKGIGSRGPESTITKAGAGSATGHNTYDDTGSLTSFALPSLAGLDRDTATVFANNNWDHLLASKPVSGCKTAPQAIPAQLGCASPIKHVFLIVRENRTYDQVFGDVAKGNGDAADAQFGASVTPNAHKLATSYGLFDNFYDQGTLSADGHNWLVQADANDYIEKEFGAFYRSYPAQGGDALAYQRDGFIWNAAAKVGLTSKAYGEYNNFISGPVPVPSWGQFYQASQIMEGKATGSLPFNPALVNTYADIPSLNAIDDHQYPAFDLGIPDQYRADIWLKSFEQSQKSGSLANLNLIWMPDDHTAGVNPTANPSPVAEVADNDLAVGRIISAISHSKYWKSSAVFVVEDDTQNGVDHVDGHRGPLLIASPYAKQGIVDSNYYTQINVVRTIEQILGFAPMNQEDRASWPMYSAFTNTPNYTPYTVQAETVPLTQGYTGSTSAKSGAAKPATVAPRAIPASVRTIYNEWVAWSRNGRFTGYTAVQDWANPAQLNRLDWYSAHDWKVPYPGDKAILPPSQVPEANLPAGYLGD